MTLAEMEARLDEIEATYASPEAMPEEVEAEYEWLSLALWPCLRAAAKGRAEERMAEEEEHARGMDDAVKRALRTLGGA